MNPTEEIFNRVTKSPLKSIDLGDYMEPVEVAHFDLKDLLFQELILREKDFRDFVKSHDWTLYEGKIVRLFCSADAIVPTWAYMLLASKLPGAKEIFYGSEDKIEEYQVDQAIKRMMDQEDFEDAKVVLKGCGDILNKEYAFTEVTKALVPHVTSLMFGEPCSTVPIYKRAKKR